MLNAEAVAHGVCRLQMWIDGADRDGGCCWRLASRRIAEAPVLQVDGRGKGRVAKFVEIHIALRCVIEDPETTTNGSFAVAEGREGKAKTRRKLAQRPVEPPGGSGRNRKNRRTVADGHVDQLSDGTPEPARMMPFSRLPPLVVSMFPLLSNVTAWVGS